ncbi:MAG: DUF126 domain-containing protein [Candidatus Odinarchaeia archaeon]
MTLHGRKIVGGKAEAPALVTKDPISFMGGVDPNTGIITEKGHELHGESVSGKILVFPSGKGSTGGAYMIYELVLNGKGPKAFINIKADPVVAVGAIIAKLPFVDSLDKNPIEHIKTGDFVQVNADEGKIFVYYP